MFIEISSDFTLNKHVIHYTYWGYTGIPDQHFLFGGVSWYIGDVALAQICEVFGLVHLQHNQLSNIISFIKLRLLTCFADSNYLQRIACLLPLRNRCLFMSLPKQKGIVWITLPYTTTDNCVTNWCTDLPCWLNYVQSRFSISYIQSRFLISKIYISEGQLHNTIEEGRNAYLYYHTLFSSSSLSLLAG